MNFNLPQVDQVYLGELEVQCKFALTAANSCQSALNKKWPNIDEFWYHIQMFLVSTANIHKMLHNGKHPKYRDHHNQIRKKYNFPEIDFNAERKIRNKFEHYDEYIVDWIKKSKHRSLATNNIMSKTMIPGNMDFFKNFDHTKNVLSFGDEEIDMVKTCKKINVLYQHIQGIVQR